MQLTINGHEVTVPSTVTNVGELLTHLQLNAELAIVELNRIILDRAVRDNTAIKQDDYIEIVQFVGGG